MLRPLRLATLLVAVALLWQAPAARAQTDPNGSPLPQIGATNGFLHWRLLPAIPCPRDTVRLVFDWCEACVHVLSMEPIGDQAARVVFESVANAMCAETCDRSRRALTFGPFPPGPRSIGLALVQRMPDGSETSSRAAVAFGVRDSCGLVVPADVLPFVESITVTNLRSTVPCPNDSLVVRVRGHFPDDCHALRAARLEPVVCITWPCLPVLRLLVDDFACLGRPCAQVPTPFEAKLVMAGLPAGHYRLGAGLSVVSCVDTFPNSPQYWSSVLFTVASDSVCGNPQPTCLIPAWRRLPISNPSCDATLDEDSPAKLTLGVITPLALSALQGRLRLGDASNLHITSLALAGPAVGMTLGWTETADGADFLMFSEEGAPIPPPPPTLEPSASPLPPPPVPVLTVEVAVRDGGHAPAISTLIASDVLGSDANGGGVPMCRFPETVFPLPNVARLCAEQQCDANRDGRSDVRDIVLMIRCLQRQCADSSRFDCDDDGLFRFADVLCCARHILRRRLPDASDGRPAPNVSVSLGALRQEGDGWALPVTIRGAGSLGAVKLDLGLPLDRFTVTGLSEMQPGVNWLGLHALDGGALMLGLLNLTDPTLRLLWPDEFTVDVRLALKPGQSAGGAFAVTGGEFTDLEGEPLAVDLPANVLSGTLRLSPARPNPFSTTTRFSLELDHGADVDVTVHDLSGRRVAVIHRGALPAGRHDLTWAGTAESGGRAADGVYFLRARVGERVLSSKVALLRAR